jgi:GxxExxY protein
MTPEIKNLCDTIRETGFAIHRYHRFGNLEKIYENALKNRLGKMGFKIEQQKPLNVYDEDGTLLGDFYADLVVNDELIIEVKACKALNDDHTAQLLGYLRSSQLEHGLLVNCGAPKFQIKKYALTPIERLIFCVFCASLRQINSLNSYPYQKVNWPTGNLLT